MKWKIIFLMYLHIVVVICQCEKNGKIWENINHTKFFYHGNCKKTKDKKRYWLWEATEVPVHQTFLMVEAIHDAEKPIEETKFVGLHMIYFMRQ